MFGEEVEALSIDTNGEKVGFPWGTSLGLLSLQMCDSSVPVRSLQGQGVGASWRLHLKRQAGSDHVSLPIAIWAHSWLVPLLPRYISPPGALNCTVVAIGKPYLKTWISYLCLWNNLRCVVLIIVFTSLNYRVWSKRLFMKYNQPNGLEERRFAFCSVPRPEIRI